MKAAVLRETNHIVYEDFCISDCKPDEVKVKVMAAGICGSDIHKMMTKWKYTLPAIMGHEFSGIVVEKGKDVSHVHVGDRVIGIPFIPCHQCEYCKRGLYSLCEHYDMVGANLYGAFAEYVNIKASNVMNIGELDFETASLIEPLAVACHAVFHIEPKLGDTVAVFGAGTIGLLNIQLLQLAGVQDIIAIDISDKKLRGAEHFGCSHTINPLKDDLLDKVNEYTNGMGVDIAMECAGSKVTQEQCLLITRKRGKVGYEGIAYSEVTLSEKAFENIFRRELTLKGFWNSYTAPFPGDEWTKGLQFVLSGKVRLSEMISHRFELKDTQKAFDMITQRKQDYNKVLIIPNKEVY
ncbi:galactitol-1-phosphate 5-dehydrogenase [Terrilactibacillus tamarindi]|uniref:galactitol-1-phosphate 5-dehydrogenase n=1 Tax=Terrilactibacillus tamarindi TaxID=2599694 RepID=UPI0018AD1653|nr:galactitol-1-phosphate 5-dehydrogenase [Terrilactibacillus tamarindi]